VARSKKSQTIADIKKKVGFMQDRYKILRHAQLAYERMDRIEYSLPEPLNSLDWMRTGTTTSPYLAIKGTVNALTNIDERYDVNPVSVLRAVDGDHLSAEAKEEANVWEYAIKQSIRSALTRRGTGRRDAVRSAAVYDEVAAQIIHVPTHAKLLNIPENRVRAWRLFGDWAIRIVHPKNILVEESDMGLERVCYVNRRKKWEIEALWGIKLDGSDDTEYVERDYVDYENKLVYISPAGADADDGEVVFGPEPWLSDMGNYVPFLPWAWAAGGTNLDDELQHRRKPVLYPVWRAELWATANILNSLSISQAIAEGAAPRHLFKNAEDTVVEYATPGGRIDIQGLGEYQQLVALGQDPQIQGSYQGIEDAIQRSTVAETLVTGMPVSGEQAYSSYQLQVQQAVASLGPTKELVERWYNGLVRVMLLTAHYTGQDIRAYGDDLDEYVIRSEDIDPDAIEIHTELTADVPIDRQQRVMSALQMADKLPYSPQRILKFLGETDPEGALREYYEWQLERADWEGYVEAVRMESSGQLQQMIRDLVMQQLEEQAQQPQMQGQMGQMANPAGPPQGVPGLEGQMANPALGGAPPEGMMPGMSAPPPEGMMP
jgi:hypothetical protein